MSTNNKAVARVRSQRHCESIKVGLILKRLDDFIHDRREMTTGQVTAARILINKVVPDAAVMPENTNGIRDITAMSSAYLMGVIEGKAKRIPSDG